MKESPVGKRVKFKIDSVKYRGVVTKAEGDVELIEDPPVNLWRQFRPGKITRRLVIELDS